MPNSLVTFDILDAPETCQCAICGKNPATLKCTGKQSCPCCLQCAFSMLADLAEWTADNSSKRAG